MLDQEKLGALLKQHAGWLFPVITAALDVQFRSFRPGDDVPISVYNFTMKKAAMQVEQEFSAALGALNLTVEDLPAVRFPLRSSCRTVRILMTGQAAGIEL